VVNVKKSKLILSSRPNLLTIRPSTPYTKIIKKIYKNPDLDFIHLEKAGATQMAAVITARLMGKKFYWIQEFANPPKASIITRFLLTQADKIFVHDRDDAIKLKKYGVKPGRVHYIK